MIIITINYDNRIDQNDRKRKDTKLFATIMHNNLFLLHTQYSAIKLGILVFFIETISYERRSSNSHFLGSSKSKESLLLRNYY